MPVPEPEGSDRRLTRFIHCAYCGSPVTVTYQQNAYPADSVKISTWACPYAGCRRENAVKGVYVLGATTRDDAKPGLPDVG